MTTQYIEMTAAELQEIYMAAARATPAPPSLPKFYLYITQKQQLEQAQQAEEQRRAKAIPIQVPDWTDVRIGTIVTRSDHWKQQTHNQNTTQLGILTSTKPLKDDIRGLVTYPIIHWEYDSTASLTHPLNATPKDGHKLPIITINGNQQ